MAAWDYPKSRVSEYIPELRHPTNFVRSLRTAYGIGTTSCRCETQWKTVREGRVTVRVYIGKRPNICESVAWDRQKSGAQPTSHTFSPTYSAGKQSSEVADVQEWASRRLNLY